MKYPDITVKYSEDPREYNRQYSAFRREDQLRGSFEKKVVKLLQLAKERAKKKSLEFSITVADLYDPVFCPLQPHLLLDYSKRGKGSAPNSPSIDRIDPAKGYVPGNVWIISAQANRMKSDATLLQLETLVANLRAKMGR